MFRAGWTDNILGLTTALGSAPDLADGIQHMHIMSIQALRNNLARQPAETSEQAERLIGRQATASRQDTPS